MPSKREQKQHRDALERTRYLKSVAGVTSLTKAWDLVIQGTDSNTRSNLGHALRFGLVSARQDDEARAYEELLARLEETGCRWERDEGGNPFVRDVDGSEPNRGDWSPQATLAQYGTVDGYDELKANIEATQSFLTPDAEFFNSDELAEARDRATESHRAGLTEPLLSNGYTARLKRRD